MVFDIKVNGVRIKSPKTFTIEHQPITDGERTLDGRMNVKGIAPKLKLVLGYDSIKVSDLMVILGETWDVFVSGLVITQSVTFPYYYGGSKTINTYFAPISATLTPESAVNDRWVDFKLEFIEL